MQLSGRSQVMTSLEHYVTITRAISLTVSFDLPIISVSCIEITKRAPRSVSRVPRARARRGRGGTRGGNGEEKRVKWTTDRVHLFTSDRCDINRYLSMKRLTIRIPGIPSNLPRGYHRVLSGTPPRVLLSRDYTHDSHFRPSSAARTDVLGDTVSVVRHLE